MRHKSFQEMTCPIALSLEHVGEWWSMLILRECFKGRSRFDEFEKDLGIAPAMLTRRLSALVEAGLLEKRPYSDHARRFEYHLTPRGSDFLPVLAALLQYGKKHFAPANGSSSVLVNAETGSEAKVAVIDTVTGQEIDGAGYAFGRI